ncbi:ankyrin [Wilcoxina mikolae CBS 423.85]|nr:ankyrin [Wilcoxina mikolae CBS 423.85]
MFENIDDEEQDSVELVRRAFFLIVHVTRPLRLDELVEALALDGDIRLDWSSTFGDPRDLIRIYTYCAQYWFNHIKRIGDEPLEDNLFGLIERFICGSPSHLRSYEEMMDYHYYNKTDRKVREQLLNLSRKDTNNRKWPVSNALFYHIIAEGLSWICRRILESRPDMVNLDIQGLGPPLRLAILAGKESMAEEILALGADIQRQCSPHDLFASKPYIIPGSNHPENDDPFDILLQYMPQDENSPAASKYGGYEYIIHSAAQHTPNLLPHFLNQGADDVHKRSGDGASPIHYATLGNTLDGVRTLVAAGADVNAQTNAGRFPFHITVNLQSALIAEYLLECGATIPHDITAKELQWVDNDNSTSLRNQFSSNELDARQRLNEIFFSIKSELSSRHSSSRQICKPVQLPTRRTPEAHAYDGIRIAASKHQKLSMDMYRNGESYISIMIKGRYLKRIEFRIWSETTTEANIHEACKNSYHRPYSWTEAIIERPTLAGSLTTALPPRQIQVDIHDSDTPRHHSVTWDIRDPTSGARSGWRPFKMATKLRFT